MSVGRNEPCPCGSGRKYKNCHYARDRAREVSRWKESLSPPVGMALEWLRDAMRLSAVKDVDNGFAISTGHFRTVIRAWAPEPDADGSDVTDVITIETTYPTGGPPGGEIIARLNAFAPLSALVQVRGSEDWISLTRLSVFRGEDAAFLELDLPLLAAAVMLQQETIPRLLGKALGEELPEALEGADVPCPVTADEFEKLLDVLDPRAQPSLSEEGISFALPWVDGEESQDVEEIVSKVTIGPWRHHVWGNGLFAELLLPLAASHEKIAVVCEELNWHEFENVHGAPLFGAWGLTEEPSPLAAFSLFIPNLFYRPAHLQLVAAWMTSRHDVVRKLVKIR